MAALKVVVLLTVIGSFSLALKLPFTKDALSRMRRQLPSPQCQTDFTSLTTNACFSFFGEGATTPTAEDAKQFCEQGCSDILKGLFKKLIADCGDFASAIDQSQLAILDHACLKDGVKHSDGLSHTCIEDFASVSDLQSPPQYVTECEGSFPVNHQCTSACRQTLDLITKTFGCCYNILAKAGFNVTSNDVWTACSRSFPKEC